MSRTYRLRHLPRYGVKHYTDSPVRSVCREWEKKVDELVISWAGRWRFELYRRAQREFPRAVANLREHPWVRWPSIARCKVEYRIQGNRIVRRTNRRLVRLEDPEEAVFLGKQDGWSLWDIF